MVNNADQHGISKLDLKRQNRMQILKILKQKGPTSRIDIAAALELTRAAVTIITNEMIEQGIIMEIGEFKHVAEKAPRGRKKILIDINHNYKFVVGAALEETFISVGLSTLAGEVLDKRNKALSPTDTADDIFSYTVEAIKEIMEYSCLQHHQMLGIGIGIHPKMYSRLNIPVNNRVPDYSEFTEKCLQYTKLPLIIDNSIKGTAMANIDFQKDRNPERRNIAFLQYDSNFNFVFTNLNDRIVSYDHRTDFVNKIIVKPESDRKCECGRTGCVLSELSPAALISKAEKLLSQVQTPYLYKAVSGNAANLTLDLLTESYKHGDEPIKNMLNEATKLLAILLNNLFFLTDPQRLVLHNFKLDESNFGKLKDKLIEIGAEDLAEKLAPSIIDPRHQFLSGCALAIRELFYTKGGFDN